MEIKTKFEIGEKVIIPAKTKVDEFGTMISKKDVEDEVKSIRINVNKKGVSVIYRLKTNWYFSFKDSMLKKYSEVYKFNMDDMTNNALVDILEVISQN